MEDGIEILIYIFFIVVSIVGGLIKNVSKKKEEERQRARRAEAAQRAPSASMPPVSGPKETINPFEEFLRRQLEQYEEPEEEILDTIPTVRSQPVDVIPERESTPIDTVPTFNSSSIEMTPISMELANEGISAFEPIPHDFNAEKYFEKDFSLSSEIKDLEKFEYDAIAGDDLTLMQEEIAGFEVSKAVIYSEILKRPVY